jgi:hypothetical protein
MQDRHPLIQEVLLRAPTGPLLDALYQRYRPDLGDFKNALTPETQQKLWNQPGLEGKRIVISSTDDLERIEKVVQEGPAIVRHAVAYNKNLTKTQVQTLHDLSVKNKDSRLAMSLVRARPDIAVLCDKSGSIFNLLSLRSGHDASEALALNILKMTLEEIKALDSLTGPTAQEFKKRGYTKVLKLYGEGYYINPVVLAEVLKKAEIGYSSKPRMTPGMHRILKTLPAGVQKTLNENLLNSMPNSSTNSYTSTYRHPGLNRTAKHSCEQQTMMELAKVMKIAGGFSKEWTSWAAAMNKYTELDLQDKVSYLIHNPNIAEEVLYHFPEICPELFKNHIHRVPVRVLQVVLGQDGATELLVDRICQGNIPTNKDFCSAVSEHLRKDDIKEDKMQDFLSVVGDIENMNNFVEQLVSGMSAKKVEEVAKNLPANSKLYKKIIQKNLMEIAIDQYATLEDIERLTELSCGTVSLKNWSRPALQWAADLIIKEMDPKNIDVLDNQVSKTTLTIPQLAKTVKLLAKR